MIHIKCIVYDNANNIQAKGFYFDSYHEKNFEILSGMTQEKFEKKLKITLDEFLTFCGHYVVKELRLKQIPTKIQQGLLRILSINRVGLETLGKVKKITMEIQIDDRPKKIVTLHHSKIDIV